MKLLAPITKKSGKQERERKVLLCLIEHYIKTGKPVGSNTLKETDFEDLSSATIRNYFAHLEEEGYLLQQHISGGRVPTDKAYRLYAAHCAQLVGFASSHNPFDDLRQTETREITGLLQNAAECLMRESKLAIFLSAPRFEQDFIIGMKLIMLDAERLLCVLLTDFGEIMSEVLYANEKLTAHTTKRLESYFNWRLTQQNRPTDISDHEEALAQNLYNEVMVRYIASYSCFDDDEIYRTGFSTLLNHSDFQDHALLSNSLAMFEHTHGMQLLLKESCKLDTLKFWIAEDLATFAPYPNPNCSILAIPYRVNRQPVGAVGILGPTRMPYGLLFELLTQFSESVSHALTKNLYKYKISLRQPKPDMIEAKRSELDLIDQNKHLLLEDNRSSRLENPAWRRK